MNKNQLRAFAIVLLLLLTATEFLLSHNTLYTHGEVMQGLYFLLVCSNLLIFPVIMWRADVGLWCMLSVGAVLLPWQAYENRRWTVLHEEVLSIIRFAEDRKEETGAYPASLLGYDYEQAWTADYISYSLEAPEFRLDYFMHDPGIGYWYESDSGFDYYPD